MKKQWQVYGSGYVLNNATPIEPKLPVGVYTVQRSEIFGLFLEKKGNQFTFPYRIYGKDSDFVSIVVTTYNNTKSNLGVLLNGVKGTGKTVTAELIANALHLPIIIIDFPHDSIVDFLSTIPQDIVVVIDEYEKIFKGDKESMLLSVMDGIHNNRYRKVYLLTTNKTVIDDNLLQRPGRIRYFKTYSNLEKEIVEEVVDDSLERKEYREGIISFVMTLELITIDIVKSLVKEVNIHDKSPEEFKSYFNVRVNRPIVDIYRVERDKDDREIEVLIAKDAEMNPKSFTSNDVKKGINLYISGYGSIGKVKSTRGERIIVTTLQEVKQGRKKVVEQVEKVYVVRKSTRINDSYEEVFNY